MPFGFHCKCVSHPSQCDLASFSDTFPPDPLPPSDTWGLPGLGEPYQGNPTLGYNPFTNPQEIAFAGRCLYMLPFESIGSTVELAADFFSNLKVISSLTQTEILFRKRSANGLSTLLEFRWKLDFFKYWRLRVITNDVTRYESDGTLWTQDGGYKTSMKLTRVDVGTILIEGLTPATDSYVLTGDEMPSVPLNDVEYQIFSPNLGAGGLNHFDNINLTTSWS